MSHFSSEQVFTFLFLMLGPFKIIGPFARITHGADAMLARRLALRAVLISGLALLLAAFLGERMLAGYGIPIPVLSLSAGIVLFLVALQTVLRQFSPLEPSEGEPAAPTLSMAVVPLAFPTIVAPYGIAVLVVFIALSPDLESKLKIGIMLAAIMLLDLAAMLSSRYVFRALGLALQILGAVLSVIQVALGLQIIIGSVQTAQRLLAP